VEENTNIDVVEETEENNLRSFEYVKAQVNVLDEVPQSYSHQRSLKLDQPRYITEKWDHESMDSKMVRLISKLWTSYQEKGHVIMDCLFVPFHIRASKHVELQNVARTLMDQTQTQEPKIHVVQNRLKGMELGSQLGPSNQQIRPYVHIRSKEPEMHSHLHSTPHKILMGNHKLEHC
jgi:hypothetical protein